MSTAEQLAAEVNELGQGNHNRRMYPAELRRRIVEHVREQRATGVRLNDIARALGISSTLLHRWEAKRTPKFKRVVLPESPPQRAGREARCSLHAPHGVRVDGLSIDDLVEVLRRLG
ncbi:MAG TPA: hypothetical protein VGP93_16570 [Polyangiaceae bacterium]|jgi:hypothetical protein|nr:hypothetical protein [Polyangiaceae bacterium]